MTDPNNGGFETAPARPDPAVLEPTAHRPGVEGELARADGELASPQDRPAGAEDGPARGQAGLAAAEDGPAGGEGGLAGAEVGPARSEAGPAGADGGLAGVEPAPRAEPAAVADGVPSGGEGGSAAGPVFEGDPTAWPPDEAFDAADLDDRGWTRRDLEAILLVADEPVPAAVLAEIVGSRLSEVEELLVDLAGEYARDGRGFVLRAR